METILLVLTLFLSDGKTVQETSTIEVVKCAGIDPGTDSSCGLGACMLKGNKRAADLWGKMPGTAFITLCNKAGVKKEEGAEGPGHAGLGFH